MIPTVTGPIAAIDGAILLNENILKDASAGLLDDEQFSLDRLWSIRENPLQSKENMRFTSVRDATQEIEAFKEKGGRLIVDTTSVQNYKNATGLVEISMRSGISVVMSAFISINLSLSKAQHVATLQKHLLYGVTIIENSADVQCGVIVVDLRKNLPNETEISPSKLLDTESYELSVAANAQQGCFEQCGGYPPILILLPHSKTLFVLYANLALSALASVSVDCLPATVLCGSSSNVDYVDQVELLGKGVSLCFDSFGSVMCNKIDEDSALDFHNATRVFELSKKFSTKLLLSHGVSQRLHLCCGGGYGYAHIQRSIVPMLTRIGMSEDAIHNITVKNAMVLLDWFTPPKPVSPVKNYLVCDLCRAEFEQIEGQYFSKFTFVYCGTACLRSHREAGFQKLS